MSWSSSAIRQSIARFVAARQLDGICGRHNPTLAARYKILLYPFFLQGVFGRPRLMMSDGKHPNAAGVQKIVAGILPMVERSIAGAQNGRRSTAR